MGLILINMTDCLTLFANILDELFKGISECGLLTSYTVQLQSNLVGLETLFKFTKVIQELIKNLQSLLLQIPSVESAEVSTQTLEEVAVTCHTNSVGTLKECPAANDKFFKDGSRRHKKLNGPLDLSHKNEIENDQSQTMVEICQLKSLLVEANENFSQIVNLESSPDITPKKTKVGNVVHIVVESPSSPVNSGHKIDAEIGEIKCSECDEVLKSREEKQRHSHRLHVNTQSCDMCDKVFTCLQSLQEHFRQEHNSVGCFLCSTCNKRFMTKLSYNRHLDTHKGKKDAICNVCRKAFSRADYLQVHYQSHLGKRNFACSLCPRKFIRSIHLRAHEKIHSGIKDHICKVCNKGFVRRDKLKEHVLRHLNIKRFQCTICQRDYAEKRDLKVHLKCHSK